MSYKDLQKKKEYDKLYRQKNRDKHIANAIAWNKAHPNERSDRALKSRISNQSKYHWNESKKRAKKLGLEFNLEISDIVIPDTCPILGIPLFYKGGPRTNNSPSVDRIDNTKGYVKENIWVISWRANHIKGNATLEELKLIVEKLSPAPDSNQEA